MDNKKKTKAQLIAELEDLRKRNAEIETAESEHKKSEDELKQSDTIFKDFFNLSADLVCIADINGYFRLLNPAWEKVLGYSISELTGKPFLDFVHPDDIDKTLAVIKEKLDINETVINFENRYICKNGKIVWLEWTSRPSVSEGMTFAIARDITERKQIETKLLQIMTAVESSSNAIGISDAQGRHFYQNKALTELFGYKTAEELQAAGGGKAVVRDPSVAKEMFANIQSGKPWIGELEMLTKDGRVFHAFERADAIKDDSGNIIGLIGIITDITEREKIEETLHYFQKAVESSSDAIGMSTPEGKHYYQNEAFTKLFGLNVEEIEGEEGPPSTVYANEKIGREIFKTIMKGDQWNGEVEMINKNNKKMSIFLRAYPIMDENDKVIGLVGLHQDITERKKMEEALRESEERFRKLSESSPIGIFQTDKDGRVLYLNDKWCELAGMGREDALGYGWTSALHPEDKPKVLDDWSECLKENKGYKGEFRFIKSSGEIRWLNTVTAPISSDGVIIGHVGANEDITERKKAEEKLTENEEKFRSLFNNTEIGIFRTRLDGSEILDMNEKFIDIFGYTREEMKGKPSVIHWVDPREREEMLRRLKVDGRVTNYECRFFNKQRDDLTCITSLKLYHGLGILEGSIIDITERVKAEEKVTIREKQLTMITNSFPGPVSLVGHDLRYKFGNRKYEQWFGLSPETIVGMRIQDVIGDEAFESAKENILKALSGEEIVFENSIVTPAGETINGLVTYSPYYEGENIPSGFYIFVTDITERKQLEEERLKASKLESIGFLAGGIAHDFNNILSSILGNTSLAKLNLDRNSEEYEMLTETENATLRATKLTQQLLTFAKGGAPVKEMAELTELIRETTEFSLRGTNVNYRTSIPADLWTAEIDKGQISQVIGNLVINAQQAMPNGGTLNIKANNVNITTKDSLPLREGNFIKISITDYGHGIPPEHLKNIFDPYFTTKQQGSGLGLATSYSIIHRHNGHITVESEIGVGTTFDIYLPASSKQIKGIDPKKEETKDLTGKILVMDDDKSIIKVLSKMLKKLGNDVALSNDGTEAIDLYKKAMDSGKPFDIVIMDLTIPGGMGGKEAINKLLEMDPNSKAIVSSGYSNDPVVSNYKKHGFSGYICKPYRLDELKKVLNEVMSNTQK